MLKIDMSFIRNLDQKKTRILTEKIIELSHELDFKVIAEGVEEKDELEILKKLNCDFVQGYYYYRPMPINELESIISIDCNIQSVVILQINPVKFFRLNRPKLARIPA